VAAPGISEDCWSVCESPTNPTPNVIALVSEGPPRMYEIRLARPITPGAVTTLTYAPGHPHAATAKFYFHPGNVNGNDLTNTIDILDLVDYLNGISTMPWGKYSTDLDHSGLTLPADILTLIEMLGGNFLGISHPIGDWYWTSLPSGEGCP